MTTLLHWLIVAVASLMTIGTLLTGLFAWRMWVRPVKRIGVEADLHATIRPITELGRRRSLTR